jgi:hypothetical protein
VIGNAMYGGSWNIFSVFIFEYDVKKRV